MNGLRQAATSAERADAVFWLAFGLSVLFLLVITVLMIAFVIRYHWRRHPRAAQIEGHPGLEITWTLVPLALFLVIFYYGWTNFEYMRHPPRDAMVVAVTARQWSYAFRYPNGKRTTRLYAPVNRPMALELTSADVLHGFFVPAFRLKLDAVPGRVNTTWFQATQPGVYDILCTVICGVEHSNMLSQVVVVPEAQFRAWYFGGEDAPEPGQAAAASIFPGASLATTAGAAKGLELLRAKGCLDCHSLDGSPGVGPTFKGLYGRREEVLSGGRVRTLTVDEARLRQAILQPGREPVRGYPVVMPTVPLEPAELNQVLDCLKALP